MFGKLVKAKSKEHLDDKKVKKDKDDSGGFKLKLCKEDKKEKKSKKVKSKAKKAIKNYDVGDGNVTGSYLAGHLVKSNSFVPSYAQEMGIKHRTLGDFEECKTSGDEDVGRRKSGSKGDVGKVISR